jgi:hypothetical protein
MADFIDFNEGKTVVATSGLPATCTFDLSTFSVGATSPFVGTETYGGAWGKLTGTGYAAKTQARPTPASGVCTFTLMAWLTGAATDWPATARSIVLSDGAHLICAWNLQAGGAARDLSAANTTENVTPTLSVG